MPRPGRTDQQQQELAMHVLIIGAAGMVGRKLTEALLRTGRVGGKAIERLTLADVVEPARPNFAGPLETIAADLSAPATAQRLASTRPDLIFHLAAIVS